MEPNKNKKKCKYEVECKKCGYKWTYNGILGVAYCPNCNYRTRIKHYAPKNGVRIVCPICNHKWIYTGLSFFALCPICWKRILAYPEQYKDLRDKKMKPEDVESVLKMIRDGKQEK